MGGSQIFRLVSMLALAAFAADLAVQAVDFKGLARAYPITLAAVVIAATVGLAVRELVPGRVGVELHPDVARLLATPRRFVWRLLGFVVLWLAYPWLLSQIGFILATSLVLSLSLWLLRFRHMVAAVLCAIVFAFAMAVLFTTVFYIPVPSGPIDSWLAQLIYDLN